MRRTAIVCFNLASIFGGLLAQEDLPKRQEPFRVQVDSVNVLLAVHDKSTGEFIADLTPGEVEIYEDGVPQTITNFAQETGLSLSIGLCIDTSSSVKIKLDFEKEAATDFVYSVMRPGDQALLLEFDTGVTLLHDFTTNPNDLTREISRLRAGGGTSLYDAIYLAAEQKMMDAPGRKTLVVLSDGADLTSQYTFEDALRLAYEAEAAIYAISTTRFGAEIDHEGDNALRQLAEKTGGRAYFPYSTSQLTKAFKAINQELRNQYNLAYTPSRFQNDGKFHAIRVKVKRDNVHLFYRKGYYSPRPDTEP